MVLTIAVLAFVVYANADVYVVTDASNNIYSLFNQKGWMPKSECWNGNKNCHHEAAPRGSKTGTQGKKGSYERSKIPDALCIDILKAAS